METIKGTTNCRLFKRAAPNVNAKRLGVWKKGQPVSILYKTKGSPFEGSDEWYALEDGVFSWAGGINVGEQEVALKVNVVEEIIEEDTPRQKSELIDYRKLISIPGIDASNNGSGIRIAMLDSGVFVDHPDFDKSKFRLPSLYNSFEEIADQNGHGTHLTGLISANSKKDKGVIGIAPEVTIEHFKVLDRDGITVFKLLKSSLEHIKNNHIHYDIINMSFNITETQYKKIEGDLKLIKESGVIMVAAAGNSLRIIKKRIFYPAFSENVISVGAVDESDFHKIKTKDLHERLDFFFRNDLVISTFKKPTLYEPRSGCSEYTAFVSGLISKLLVHENIPKRNRFSFVKRKLEQISSSYSSANQLIKFKMYKTI